VVIWTLARQRPGTSPHQPDIDHYVTHASFVLAWLSCVRGMGLMLQIPPDSSILTLKRSEA